MIANRPSQYGRQWMAKKQGATNQRRLRDFVCSSMGRCSTETEIGQNRISPRTQR